MFTTRVVTAYALNATVHLSRWGSAQEALRFAAEAAALLPSLGSRGTSPLQNSVSGFPFAILFQTPRGDFLLQTFPKRR